MYYQTNLEEEFRIKHPRDRIIDDIIINAVEAFTNDDVLLSALSADFSDVTAEIIESVKIPGIQLAIIISIK